MSDINCETFNVLIFGKKKKLNLLILLMNNLRKHFRVTIGGHSIHMVAQGGQRIRQHDAAPGATGLQSRF
jgi:hypothetical protein